MAIEKVVNITVNTKGSQQAIAQTEKLNQKFKQLNETTGELKGGLKESGNAILENGGAMGLLNDATGGLAMTVKDAVEATGLFTKGTTIATTAQKAYTAVVGTSTGALKALKVALVTTGLGALVVALGYLVSAMMDSTDATEQLTEEQERLNAQLSYTKKLTDDLIKSLDYYTNIDLALAKKRGASSRELKKIEIDGINAKIKANTEEINRIKATQDKEYKLTKEQSERIQALREQNQDLVRQGNLSILEFEAEQSEQRRQKDAELQKQLLENKRKADEEKKKLEEEYQKSLQQGLNEFQIAVNEAEFEQRRLNIENRQAQADEIARIAQKQYDEEAEAQRKALLFTEIVEQSKVDLANNTINLLGQLAKKGSAVAKGLAIANVVRGQVESVSKIISSTAEANAKAVALSPLTGGQPFVTFNTISAGVGIASSVAGAIKAIKDINSESKSASGGNVSSGGGGGGTPSAPSFNLVAGTGTNQIAEGLATQRRPLQAYVVSGAVTSAQSLDRNIVNDASI